LLGHAGISHDAGIIDQDVHAIEALDSRIDHGLHLVWIGHITSLGEGRATCLGDLLRHLHKSLSAAGCTTLAPRSASMLAKATPSLKKRRSRRRSSL
jgi:hypothetical protein